MPKLKLKTRLIIFAIVALLINLAIFMPNRYEQIKFSEISGKSNQEFYDLKNKKAFHVSEKIQIEDLTKRIRLAEDYSSQQFEDIDFELGPKLLANFAFTNGTKNYNYSMTRLDGEVPKIYRRDDFGVFALRFTFPGGYTAPRYLLSFRNKLIAFTYNSAEYVSYSTDQGSTFAHTAWIYAKPRDHVVGSDGLLYIATSDGEVIRTADGVVWELYYDGSSSSEEISSIEELDGYIYAIVSTQGFVDSNFCRILSDELQYLESFNNDYNETTIKKFGNRIIISDISDKKIDLYEFDKGDVGLIGTISNHNYTKVSLLYADKYSVYFSASVATGLTQHQRYLFRMSRGNGLFFLKDFGEFVDINQAIGFNGKLVLQGITFDEDAEPDGDFQHFVYDNGASPLKTATTGYIELPILDFKHKPCYLVARHKKLGANASYTVVANLNHASGFATAVTSNSVDDSVEQVADIKHIGEVTAIEFKITLADSTPVKGVEDIEFYYLYVTTGIENLK